MVSVEHKLVSGIAWDYFTHPYFFPTVAVEGRNAEESVPFREEAEANVMFRYAISARAWRLLEDWTYMALGENSKRARRRSPPASQVAGKATGARNTQRKVPSPHLH